MKKLIGLFFLSLFVSAGIAFAEPVVVADAQVKSLPDDQYLVCIRSSGPQAFDVISEEADRIEVLLYQARLGGVSSELSAEFGSIHFTEEQDGRVKVTLDFNSNAYKAKVSQGSDGQSVDIRIGTASADAAAPVIENLNASSITGTTTEISWTTDEAADGAVVLEENGSEIAVFAEEGPHKTEHRLMLTDLSPQTVYSYLVRSADADGNTAESERHIFETGLPVFQEQSGSVVMEAENFNNNISRWGNSWSLKTTSAGYAGDGYMVVPDRNVYLDSRYHSYKMAELVYKINFKTPGNYFVWIRGRAAKKADDAVHSGRDNSISQSADNIHGFAADFSWSRETWDGAPAKITIPAAGVHTFHLFMCKDGLEVDRILLTTDSSSVPPAGEGPAQSPR